MPKIEDPIGVELTIDVKLVRRECGHPSLKQQKGSADEPIDCPICELSRLRPVVAAARALRTAGYMGKAVGDLEAALCALDGER